MTARSDLAAAVRQALGQVLDPELDEPITELGFVDSCTVESDGRAVIHLRLPTYFCAPNFAYLMVADAQEAAAAVAGIREVDVVLDGHFAADEISGGVADGRGFVDSFPGLAAAELDDLRAQFRRKAVLAATDRVCRPLLRAGRLPTDLGPLTLSDVEPSSELDRLIARRDGLGLPAGPDAPLVVDPATGDAVPAAALALHLHQARLSRVSTETNGELCRSLLAQRYPVLHINRRPDPRSGGDW